MMLQCGLFSQDSDMIVLYADVLSEFCLLGILLNLGELLEESPWEPHDFIVIADVPCLELVPIIKEVRSRDEFSLIPFFYVTENILPTEVADMVTHLSYPATNREEVQKIVSEVKLHLINRSV